jgi:hypothetical protein
MSKNHRFFYCHLAEHIRFFSGYILLIHLTKLLKFQFYYDKMKLHFFDNLSKRGNIKFLCYPFSFYYGPKNDIGRIKG